MLISRIENQVSPDAPAEMLRSKGKFSPTEIKDGGELLQSAASSTLASTKFEPVLRMHPYSASFDDDKIDKKYSNKGRFGFGIEDKLSTLDDTKSASHHPHGIPKLGLFEGSVSDTESTSGKCKTPFPKLP